MRKLATALRDLGYPDAELSVLITGDEEIRALNEKYLGRKGPTNVLAFPMTNGKGPDPVTGLLGDIVISVDRAAEEARQAGEPLTDTFYRLLIHGLLHLLGYDHERSEKEARNMEKQQERLLSLIREV
ncbi:MAG: rRNA maturation RNase YbeY [Deltaproteobacteria bacterium]|nr:rRNA maturation RNase YbeY [Deltaproteobacteria bacterium]